MGLSPAAILYDENGNALEVVDGRLQVDTPGSVTNWAQAVNERLTDSGGSPDMVVDGSGTPVSFTFDADPTDDLALLVLRIVFVPNVIKFKASTFGALSALTNGVEVSVTSSGVKTVLGVIKLSEDFLFLGDAAIETGLSENDLLVLAVQFGGLVRLVAGSGDKVEIVIRDDVVSEGANSTKYFQATAIARKV
jgi:hypothetical protein